MADIESRKEAASMEIFLSLKGMQISVINNVNLEIALVTIYDNINWVFEDDTTRKVQKRLSKKIKCKKKEALIQL